MRVCPHCGKETRAADRFCLHCGQRVEPEPQGSPPPPPLFVAANGGGWTLAPAARAGTNGAATSKAPPPDAAASAAPARPVSLTPPPSGATPPNAPPPRAEPATPAAQPAAKARLALQPRPGTDERAREFALDGSEVTIGRAPNCRVVLADDQLASRRHAALRYDGDHYTIADLGSSNGTYVNGTEIKGSTPVRLNEGDRITVGEHELLYTAAAGTDAAAQPAALTTDGLPVPVPPPWPPSTPAGETDLRLPAVSMAKHAQPEPSAHAPEVAAGAPAAAAAVRSGSPASGIEQLQVQLVEASAALARRVEAAEQETARLRSALAALAQRAADALAPLGGADTGSVGLDELVRVARETAENPRHLDHVTALAERAGEVARALESEWGLASALRELRDRMTGLAERGNE